MPSVQVQPDTPPSKCNSFSRKAKPLLESRFASEQNAAARPEYSMPGQVRSSFPQCSSHSARGARVPGSPRYLPISRYLAPRDTPHHPQDAPHVVYGHCLRDSRWASISRRVRQTGRICWRATSASWSVECFEPGCDALP